jgi:AcrR family transcriptional regulator
MASPARRAELSPLKRRTILEGARLAFAEFGFDRASVDLIAARAGVAKATIYSHFDDKRALYLVCFSEEADAVRDGFRRSLPEVGGDPASSLQRVGEKLIRIFISPTFVSLYRHTAAEADRFPEVGATFFARGPTVVYGAVADWLRRWEALGVLRLGDARSAAVQFVLLCQGDLVIRAQLGLLNRPPAGEVRDTVRRAVRTFLRAYAP